MKKEPICQLCNGRKMYNTYMGGDWILTTCPVCNPNDPWYREKPSERTQTHSNDQP